LLLHTSAPQLPDEQLAADELGRRQLLPQLPQFCKSLFTSTQRALQLVSEPQLQVPPVQLRTKT
jgi:hypothetical protein